MTTTALIIVLALLLFIAIHKNYNLKYKLSLKIPAASCQHQRSNEIFTSVIASDLETMRRQDISLAALRDAMRKLEAEVEILHNINGKQAQDLELNRRFGILSDLPIDSRAFPYHRTKLISGNGEILELRFTPHALAEMVKSAQKAS